MAEEKAVSADIETPSDTVEQLQESTSAVEEAQESVDELRARIQLLEAKSTKAGRTHAKEIETLKKDLDSKDKDLSKAVQDNRQWIERELRRQDLPDDARRSLEHALGSNEKTGPKATAERDMWRAIATEEDPKVRKALVRRAERGKFLDSSEIDELRSDLLAEDEEDDKKTVKKEPPKVGVRTAGTSVKTLDSQIEEAKKNKDPRAMWEAMIEKARTERTNARG